MMSLRQRKQGKEVEIITMLFSSWNFERALWGGGIYIETYMKWENKS